MEEPTQRSGARKVVLGVVAGAVIGFLLGLMAPAFLGPRLPLAVRGADAFVTGVVLAKKREGDRLLLTVGSPAGATLATFTKKIEEIALLVDVGDTLSFELRRYSPFIEDPTIAGVRKPGAAGAVPAAASDTLSGAGPPRAPPGAVRDTMIP